MRYLVICCLLFAGCSNGSFDSSKARMLMCAGAQATQAFVCGSNSPFGSSSGGERFGPIEEPEDNDPID